MPDMRGFGWSEYPDDDDFRKETLADDVIAMLDALQLKQVGLVGHDWGGWVGFLACLNQPERFNAYLALSILHPFQKTDSRLLHYWRGLYQLPIAAPILGEYVIKHKPNLVENGVRNAASLDAWTEDEMNVFIQCIQQPLQAKASTLLYRQFLIKEFSEVMQGKYRNQKLTGPTKLLIGDKDPYVTKYHIQGYKQYAKAMQSEIISHCGHFIPEELPEKVASEIKQLVA